MKTLTQQVTPAQVAADPTQALAQVANTVARPGVLTTEWWTVLLAGATSAILAAVGLPGGTAAQVAGIVAPVVLALLYAFARVHTKGVLADALQALFPQASTNPPGDNNGAPGAGAPSNGTTPDKTQALSKG